MKESLQSILFVCTGNSCRSQMAEALARHLLSPEIRVASAGTEPASAVNPGAIAAMDAWGLDMRAQFPKTLDSITPNAFDLVITVCDDADKRCPVVPGKKRLHWPLADPALVRGPAHEVALAFQNSRSNILTRILELKAELESAQLRAHGVSEPAIGVIGGSGFYDLPGLGELKAVRVETPFGAPSDDLLVGRFAGKKVVFLARHGRGHAILPSELNARANIYAMKRMGVTKIISVTAVGSLREHIAPGDVVLVDQFVDRTSDRPNTFFGEGVVAHVSLADPVCKILASQLEQAARREHGRVHRGGTYVCINGPQFSTRAESVLMQKWGGDVVGMTALPEARLAREAEICYASLCLPTDYDCWHPTEQHVEAQHIIGVLNANVAKGRRILALALTEIDLASHKLAADSTSCGCATSLDAALFTPVEKIGERPRVRLHAVLSRRLACAANRI